MPAIAPRSVTDGDDDQTTAQDGQTSDDDSEETSGNAIKVTHDTPLGSKGNGADQLIKTFGILRAARIFAPRRFARLPEGLAVLRAGGELSNKISLIWVVQSPSQKYSHSLLTQLTCISFAIPAHAEGRFAIVTDVGQGMRWTQVARRKHLARTKR